MVRKLVILFVFLIVSNAVYAQSFLSEIRIIEAEETDTTSDLLSDASTDKLNHSKDETEEDTGVDFFDMISVDQDANSSIQHNQESTTDSLNNAEPVLIQDSAILAQAHDARDQSTDTQPSVAAEEEKDIIDSIISFIQEDTTPIDSEESFSTEIVSFPDETMIIETDLNFESLSKVQLLIENEEYDLALEYLQKLPDKPVVEESDAAFAISEYRAFLLLKSHYKLAGYLNVKTVGRDYIQNFGNGEYFYQSYYYFSSALFELGDPLEFTSLITDDFFIELSSRESHNLRKILIQDAIKHSDVISAFDYLVDVDGNLIPYYEDWLDQVIEKTEKVQDINEILERNTHQSIKSALYLKKIQLLVRDSLYQEAKDYLQVLFTEEDLDENLYTRLAELRDYIAVALNTKPYKIGVVLPLGHKRLLGRLSQEVMDGLELASQEFSIANSPVQLVFKDSYINHSAKDSLRVKQNKNRARVETCIRELVEEDKVIAILGPVTKSSSIVAGEVADKYKIPVISFSQTESIGEKLPFLFRYYRKQTQEAEVIAKYATDYLNAKRFVVFYPAEKTEKQIKIVAAFEKVIKERKGKIVGAVRIHKKQVDFQEGFLSFTGGLKPMSAEEKEEMEKARERFQADLDFDAIFIQGTPETLMNISSFLHLYGAKHAWILSGSNINTRRNKLLKYTRKLRFVDAFPISNTSTFLRTFSESHWRNYNYRNNYQPPTAYTIFAYETIELLSKLLNDPAFHNRESLRNAIQNLNDFPVLTGKVTTGHDGDLIKDLKVLKISRKNTVEVFPSRF